MPERIMDTKGLLKRTCVVCGEIFGQHSTLDLQACLNRIDVMLMTEADVDASTDELRDAAKACLAHWDDGESCLTADFALKADRLRLALGEPDDGPTGPYTGDPELDIARGWAEQRPRSDDDVGKEDDGLQPASGRTEGVARSDSPGSADTRGGVDSGDASEGLGRGVYPPPDWQEHHSHPIDQAAADAKAGKFDLLRGPVQIELEECGQCGETADEFIGGGWFCKTCIASNDEQVGQTPNDAEAVLCPGMERAKLALDRPAFEAYGHAINYNCSIDDPTVCTGCFVRMTLQAYDYWRTIREPVPTATPGLASVLRNHFLAAITCNHATNLDKASCGCSLVDLGWHPNVGAAVESWVQHVLGLFPSASPGDRARLARKIADALQRYIDRHKSDPTVADDWMFAVVLASLAADSNRTDSE